MNKTQEFPIILESGKEFATSLVNWIDENVKRVKWNSKYSDTNLSNRSAKKIITSGETSFINPCLDLTLVSAAITQYNGLPHYFIIEEHGKTKEVLYGRLHFALDILDETGGYFVNFRNSNNVQIGKGRYLGRRDLPQEKLIRINYKKMDYNRPLHLNLGHKTIESTIESEFPKINVKLWRRMINLGNTEDNYKKYIANFGNNFNIQYLS